MLRVLSIDIPYLCVLTRRLATLPFAAICLSPYAFIYCVSNNKLTQFISLRNSELRTSLNAPCHISNLVSYLGGSKKKKKTKAVPLHTIVAHGGGGRGGIAPTHS
jgi:hypothetical protein